MNLTSTIPVIRRLIPSLIASEIADVQPMVNGYEWLATNIIPLDMMCLSNYKDIIRTNTENYDRAMETLK